MVPLRLRLCRFLIVTFYLYVGRGKILQRGEFSGESIVLPAGAAVLGFTLLVLKDQTLPISANKWGGLLKAVGKPKITNPF